MGAETNPLDRLGQSPRPRNAQGAELAHHRADALKKRVEPLAAEVVVKRPRLYRIADVTDEAND